MVTALDKYR